MKKLTIENRIEHRMENRHTCSEGIFFASQGGFYEGKLKDYSRSGLFIKTDEILPIGAILTIANPNPDGEDEKLKGQILWRDNEGFGVELFRPRNEMVSEAARLDQRSLNRDL